MQWGRKFGPVLLAVLVLWTAIPALVCLPTMHPMANHSCCMAMAGDCPSPEAGASGACCQIAQQSPTLPQVSQFSVGYSLRLALVAREEITQPLAISVVCQPSRLEAVPPKSSSGSASTLRI